MRRLCAVALLGTVALVPMGCRHVDAGGMGPRDRAMAHLASRQYDQALPYLEELHRASPADLEIARALAEAHVRSHRAESFLARLERSVQPGADDEGRPPAVTLYLLGLTRFAGPGQADRAIADFEQAVALSPNASEFVYRLGIALLESEQYERALPSLRRAAELSPERSDVLLPLAKALSRTGDRKGAVAVLNRFVRSEPSREDVATARALMEGIADPFARFPQSSKAKLEEGIVWLHERDVPQQAIISFEEILRDYPDIGVVHALLGLCYQRIDDAGRAVDEFKRAIELSSEDGRNHLYLALLYQARQRPEQAAPHLERALELNPMLDEAWFHLGDRHLERGELEKAAEAFRVVSRLQPDAVAARGKYALVLQMQGDFAAADRELRSVVERQPENLEFLLRLGLLHFERRKQAQTPETREQATLEAETWLRKVLTLQPENAVASRALEALRSR
ncbi:MAG: tetratricopeptide repeat protein [Myxococcaceae bacterium]